MIDARTILKQFSLRPTPTRLSILNTLISKPRLSADDILAELKNQNQSCDRVTVYRNLDALQQQGILCVHHFGQRQGVYELRDNPHHHHVICEKCGQVITDEQCNIGMPEYIKGYKISHHHVNFYGLCPQCQQTN